MAIIGIYGSVVDWEGILIVYRATHKRVVRKRPQRHGDFIIKIIIRYPI